MYGPSDSAGGSTEQRLRLHMTSSPLTAALDPTASSDSHDLPARSPRTTRYQAQLIPGTPLLALPLPPRLPRRLRAPTHRTPNPRRPTASETSDSSFYTARTSDTFYSASSGSSTSTLTRKVSTRSPGRPPSLRRKISPTELSLRELRTKHSRQCLIRAKQSEEQLQRVYESQILAYLEGSFVGLDRVAD
ncbi:hypothetical protein LTR53_003682 [Teratosphaeriaceae sp. CCFEE 6253]|nr:hypothetical protein LTR53_003682 [Teratosphaeriaceae sp. CCFEE 6253]